MLSTHTQRPFLLFIKFTLFILITSPLCFAEDSELSATTQNPTAKIAIIIDDIGHNRDRGLKALSISGQLTYAIIPHSPYALFFAEKAHQQNKELMLHVPMSNISQRPIEPSVLTETMSEEEFQQTLRESIATIPNIRGINNHMGSLLTQQSAPMEWLMETLHQKGLYFIDSRTTPLSVAWHTAQRLDVPSLKRDIFLDHERSTEFLEKQFSQLLAIAQRRGYAIGIAHPHNTTMEFLEDNLPRLNDLNIELVPASEVVSAHSPNIQDLQAKM
jgi:polysaccharide deacetylase 2 family uncharacterized protein YibQ